MSTSIPVSCTQLCTTIQHVSCIQLFTFILYNVPSFVTVCCTSLCTCVLNPLENVYPVNNGVTESCVQLFKCLYSVSICSRTCIFYLAVYLCPVTRCVPISYTQLFIHILFSCIPVSRILYPAMYLNPLSRCVHVPGIQLCMYLYPYSAVYLYPVSSCAPIYPVVLPVS